MEELEILEGWFTLHDFRILDWSAWNKLTNEKKADIKEEIFLLFKKYETLEKNKEGSFAFYNIVGHKSDFLFLNLRPTLNELTSIEHDFNQTQFAQYTKSTYSYVSVVELSNYVVNREHSPEIQAMIEARLKPILPKTKHVCFYPMNKRRQGADNNWYILTVEERRRMMKSHGLLGRKFAGKVTQMIGGSIGLDDWEWGVTLFAEDPLTFKHIVTEMRFDEVSAKYADFGSFYIGNLATLDPIFITRHHSKAL